MNIYADITFSSDFFIFANKQKLEIAIFDKYGNKVGSFVPASRRFSLRTEINQIGLLNDEVRRLETAKRLENAAIYNLRANLKYYARRLKTEELDTLVEELTGYLGKVNEMKSIDELLLLEARSRSAYYRGFNYILQDERFLFTERTKRPPKDPLNSMISFGNTLVYQRLASEINKTSLDIRYGIIHSSNSRTESLNLDIADLFKPLLVDKTIFTLVNRRIIDSEEDFVEVENGGIYLSRSGKRKFIQAYEQKLYSTIKIGEVRRTYDAIMHNEIMKYKRFIDGKAEKYKPFKIMD